MFSFTEHQKTLTIENRITFKQPIKKKSLKLTVTKPWKHADSPELKFSGNFLEILQVVSIHL